MTPYVDVHLIKMPTHNAEWFEQCMLPLAAEPVKTHIVLGEPGIPQGLVASRLEGFSLGESPYISFVDPDDYALPGLFSTLLAALEATGAHAVYAHEYITGIRGDFQNARVNPLPHHAIVFRREQYERVKYALERWDFLAQESEVVVMLRELNPKMVIEIPRPLYVWRRHTDSALIREHLRRLYLEQ